MRELTNAPGKGSVRAKLTKVARTALDFYPASFPLAASLFATRELLSAHRGAMRDLDTGPRDHRPALPTICAPSHAWVDCSVLPMWRR